MTAINATSRSGVLDDHARPQGLERVIMSAGVAMLEWAQRRADRKAAGRDDLSEHERYRLASEATMLRDSAYAERAYWHAIG